MKLDSVIKGWRIRKIMKTKEIENNINQIKDYQNAMNDLVGEMSISERRIQLQKALEISRYNTVNKMISLITKMEFNGLWLMYKKLEHKEKSGTGPCS